MSRLRQVLRSKVGRCHILVDVPILLELPSLLVEYAIVTDLRHRDFKIRSLASVLARAPTLIGIGGSQFAHLDEALRIRSVYLRDECFIQGKLVKKTGGRTVCGWPSESTSISAHIVSHGCPLNSKFTLDSVA
jgi:hypothetical protein